MSIAVNYLMTYVIENMIIPGKSEAFIIILDLNNVAMTELPLKNLRQVLQSA